MSSKDLSNTIDSWLEAQRIKGGPHGFECIGIIRMQQVWEAAREDLLQQLSTAQDENDELRQHLAALSDHQIAYETQAEQKLAEAQAESENLRNVLYQARQDHGYELARMKRIASEQLASRDAEILELKNNVTICVVRMGELRQQLAEAQADAIEQARIVGMGGEREIDLRQKMDIVSALLSEASGRMSYGHWSSEFRARVETALKTKAPNC